MKKILLSLASLAMITGLYSCSDDFKIASPYKNITVVYGLLNMGDTAHYVRIQKAFMDENKSAVDMAKVADSSFYASLDVKIQELNSGGAVISTIPLQRVDLTNEGYPKDTGAFYNTPSYAYKFKYALNATNKYKLVIANSASGEKDSAVTNVITNSASELRVIEWGDPLFKLEFSRSQSFFDVSLVLPTGATTVQGIVRFHWVDSNIVTGASAQRSADFSVQQKDLGGGATLTLKVQNLYFYDFLKTAMGTPAPNVYRYMKNSDMILYVAGEEYTRYKNLNSNNGGLTANEIRPTYTNIRGENVLGIFSTRASNIKKDIIWNQPTKDSLLAHPLTKDLNIRW